jgi:TolB-like protein/class 3 adenylate cyclase/Flp pilus assembly protein TadD
MAAERQSRVERRLAAILAADAAGYSRLMGLDEVGTAKALREHLIVLDALVAKHGGRIVKTTGDGLLIEFHSVVDAVECALAIQAVMAERNDGVPPDRRMLFRVGINLGDVLVDGDDILGDGVNVAARLEGIAEPGGICISSSAYDQVRGKVAATFTDLGERSLKNIDRLVRAYTVVQGATGRKAETARASPSPASVPPRLSIVVLPFANIGGDPEQEYFVDGITENLTTDLSRISGSFVIARNTAFTYKGKPIDVKQIGRDLNVRYVLEGSVQRGGNRMRVNVQLVDAESGAHLWAERFDKPLTNLFDMQDEVVARLANALNAQLTAVEARRAEQSPRPDSIDLLFEGMAWLNKGAAPENLARARGFFERALALDPANIDALVWIAAADVVSGAALFSTDRAARLASAEGAVVKALSLAPDHAMAHYCLGLVQNFTNRASPAIAEFERAVALDRNNALAHGGMGFAKLALGRGEETEAHIEQALRLSPRDPIAYVWAAFAGMSKLYLGRDEEAAAWLRRSIEFNRNYSTAHLFLAASLAQRGKFDEARAVAAAGMTLDPTFTIRRFRSSESSDNAAYLAGRERAIEGMRNAGVPDR